MRFENDYKRFYGEQDLEYLHISEYLLDLIDDKKLTFKDGAETITFHDPCRLGKYLGIYNTPRDLLKSVVGVKINEMEHTKDKGNCCGQSLFLNCSKSNELLQKERLEEAKATGSDKLITACPKCQIHFNCAIKSPGRPDLERVEMEIPIEDLVVFMARYVE